MAERLLQYYKYMNQEMGLAGQIKLAQETKLPSPRAILAPDDDININMFKEAVAKITGKPAPNF